MADYFLRASTEASMLVVLEAGGLIVADAEAALPHFPAGYHMADGVSIVWFGPNEYVIEKAVLDANGDVVTPAVTDSGVSANIRTTKSFAEEIDARIKRLGTRSLHSTRFPSGRGGVDRQRFAVNVAGGTVELIDPAPTFKRNIWYGDAAPPEWG